MKQYQLQEDHQGFTKGQIFSGPKPILHSLGGMGYFIEEEDSSSTFCFYQSYVESNPNLFVEQKKSPDENQGIV